MLLFADGDVSGWASVGALMLNIGFSGVVAWYLLTKAMPKMQDQFIAAIDKQQDKFDRVLSEQRSSDEKSIQAVIAHCDKESSRRDELFRIEINNLTKSVEDLGKLLDQVRFRQGT